jgi:putative DNA primase/helicase
MDTIGKLLNVCDDLNSLDDGAKIAEGRLKSFVSGNAIQIDRKGLRPIRVTPTARLLFLTNELPHFRDRSSGVWRRLIVVPFDRTIENRIPGMDRPEFWAVELPGVLNWALDGLDRLRGNGWQFSEPQACRQAREDHRIASNPAREFLVERYEPAEGGFVASSTLYTEYTVFCDTHGYRGKLSRRKYGEEVRRLWPAVQSGTERQYAGKCTSKTVRGWVGLRAKGEADEPSELVTQVALQPIGEALQRYKM